MCQSNRQEDEPSFSLCCKAPHQLSHGKSSRFRPGRKPDATPTHPAFLMYRYIEFCVIQFWSLLSVSFIPSVLPFCHDKGSCLFPDAQTLFMVSLNNSALMEIFSIGYWSPLGAVDGLLLEIGIYESWSDGTKGGKKACYGVNTLKTELKERSKNRW